MTIPHKAFWKNLNLDNLKPEQEELIRSRAREFFKYKDIQFSIENNVIEEKTIVLEGLTVKCTKFTTKINEPIVKYPGICLGRAMQLQARKQDNELSEVDIIRKKIKKTFRAIQRKKQIQEGRCACETDSNYTKPNKTPFVSDGTIKNVRASGYAGSPPDPVIETNGVISMGLSNTLVPYVYDGDLNATGGSETPSGIGSTCCDPTINWDEYDQRWFVTSLWPGGHSWRSTGPELTGWEYMRIPTITE